MQTNWELVYLIYLLTNASLHRSPQEQIEPHQFHGFCPHRWLCSATSKSKLGSKGRVRGSMFSPQHVSTSLGLSSTPLSAPRKPPGLDRKKFATIVTPSLGRRLRVKQWRSQGTFVIPASCSIYSLPRPCGCGASRSLLCPMEQEKPQQFSPGGCRESERWWWREPCFQCETRRSSGGGE